MFTRLATVSDLDAMTWVLIGASPLDPIYPYRFPDRHLYPDEFTTLCRQKCREYLATSTVVVCEMEEDDQEDVAYADALLDLAARNRANTRRRRAAPPPGGRRTKVVAFSAWDTPIPRLQPVGEPLPHGQTSSPQTIGHKTRMQAFRTQCATSKQQFFDQPYKSRGVGHMFLKILLCHPAYQRRGAGSALTRWGIDQAAKHRLDTTVFASPMGLELYKKLGFEEVGRFRVQVDGDDEYLEIPALVLEWKDERGLAEKSGCEVGSLDVQSLGTRERGILRIGTSSGMFHGEMGSQVRRVVSTLS
ncbi:putative N-acetyltransferase ycf52-like protein [Rhypophila decipiens]|uniref:N-acetyltransferase ycf52-like protein n=1 Tax=Rhypophila decipiens TaxID=261697 RepID=A0AAN7BAR1_9PEZI|nr:putative N-acetyltransferase ycf52-like protein [Rhypophila decipiens]